MVDDGKRSELICFKASERVLIDLNRMAAMEERSLSDYLHGIVRRSLYGTIVRCDNVASQSTSSNKVDQGAE